MILIKGLMAAARSVFFTLVLLLVLLYIFAIALTQLLKTTDAGERLFPNVLESMNTLWIYATLLNEVSFLARELRASLPYTLILLTAFILAASLTVMNMLIGVLCEVVNEIATAEKEEAALSFVKYRIESVFDSLDIDSKVQRISKTQFETLIQNGDAIHAFYELGVDVVQLVDMADFIFQSDEVDDNFQSKDKELSFDEFMDVVCDLRGHNFATVKDIMQLRKFIRDENSKALHHSEDHMKDHFDHCVSSNPTSRRATDSANTEATGFLRTDYKPGSMSSASLQSLPLGRQHSTGSYLSVDTMLSVDAIQAWSSKSEGADSQ